MFEKQSDLALSTGDFLMKTAKNNVGLIAESGQQLGDRLGRKWVLQDPARRQRV